MTDLWTLLTASLQLKEQTFQIVETPNGFRLGLILFSLAVLSKSIGEAGILLINRATKAQFVRGVVVSLGTLGFAALVWSGCIWLSCRFALGLAVDERIVFAIVLISYAPLVFSFLAIIPHLGLLVFRVLTVWGLFITVAGLHFHYHLTLLQALGCSGIGWVLFFLLNSIFGSTAQKMTLRLLGREEWLKPKAAALALLEQEVRRP